ncbi:transposase [Nonomuraea sp. NPDC049028]|uniref:transposase n=1 Tax=Nonomuraea sp. NPDC049028 TaxID=3364348 RepID=UPI0037178723
MPDAAPDRSFGCPDLTTFCRLDVLGLEVIGQRLEPDRAVLACRVVEPDQWCRRCGCEGTPRDTVTRRLAHEPLGWRPTTLVQHLTVARVAEGLGVAWNTANDAALAEGKRVLIDDPGRFDGVTVIGVDEHVWRHTRRGDKYVTVITDLTPIRGNGPTEAINGQLEHLRGSALGFRNLTNYIARSLLETGGFRPQLHPRL